MFSTTFRYGLISLVELATSDQLLQAGAIAERHGLSANYLSVVLAELRRLGLVQSRKGKNGGYQLSCIPSEVTLLQLYRTLAGGSDATSTDPGPRRRNLLDDQHSLPRNGHEADSPGTGSPGADSPGADRGETESQRALLWLERISQRWARELESTTLADLLA